MKIGRGFRVSNYRGHLWSRSRGVCPEAQARGAVKIVVPFCVLTAGDRLGRGGAGRPPRRCIEVPRFDASFPARDGDGSIVAQAMTAYWRPMFVFINRMIDNPAEAEDLTQEVFLRLCQNAREVLPEGRKSWLFSVAHNLAVDYLRGLGHEVPLTDKEDPEAHMHFSGDLKSREPNSEEILIQVEDDEQADAGRKDVSNRLRRDLSDAVQSLPDSQREVALYIYVAKMSVDQCAAAVGKSEQAVDNLKNRLYTRILEFMQAHGWKHFPERNSPE